MRRALLVLLVLAVPGCAYYNAMYNARRLTDAAEKAEREGRTFDANSFWGQVTVKAETMLARHGDSRYAPEANALLGRAQARLGNCARARPALEAALAYPLDSAVASESRYALAGCYSALGLHQQALTAYEQILGSSDSARQDTVRVGLLRSLRAAGRADEAVALTERYPGLPRAARLEALAAAGRGAEALALADSLLAGRDSTVAWDSIIVWLARRDRATASQLVDRAVAAPGVQPSTGALWLLDDATRLAEDPVRARARLERVRDQQGAPDAAATARLRLIRLDLAATTSEAELPPLLVRLEREAAESPLAAEAEGLAAAIRLVASAADSASAAVAAGDLALFLAAEAARDQLHAPALASALFLRVPVVWPGSPYAPKALLAAAQLRGGDTLLVMEAESRYPTSPYVVRDGADRIAALRALEDSLGAFAAARGVTAPPSTRRPPPQRPGPARAQPTGPVR
ncbi:MAG TPA: hypothetical protein VFU00_12770 [Gemmatimonadales bacterium]|nr:hypothetical protein [Gemmatimonadales bacterium]